MDKENSIQVLKTVKTVKTVKTPRDLAQIIKKTPIVIIKISASWCGPCKNKKFLESYHDIKASYLNTNAVRFVEFDIDNDADILEDKDYYDIEIDSVPTFLIGYNGSFTRKFVGGGYLNEINEYIINKINLLK